jgi:hypothetical protein
MPFRASIHDVGQFRPFQLLLPMTIRLNLVHKDGSLFASVPAQIALTVSLEIQPTNAATAGN